MQDIPYGFCQCGCGQRTNIAHATYPPYGWVKGEPLRYVRGHSGRNRPKMSDDERRARRRAQSRAWAARNKTKIAASSARTYASIRRDPARYARFLRQGRESYARHADHAYLYALNWRAQHRERVRLNGRSASAKRRSRVGTANADVTDYAQILRHDPCAYCGAPATVIDHIDALACGGTHESNNLTAACRSCNARKRTIPLLVFLARIAS